MPSRREHERQLTEYLARLQVGLLGMPTKERDEAYRELAQHVEALVDEAISAGGDRDEATRIALQRFGEPELIGRKVVLDYARRSYRAPAWILTAGMVLMASLQGVVTVSAVALNLSVPTAMTLGAGSGIPLGLATAWVSVNSGARNGLTGTVGGNGQSLWARWVRRHRYLLLMTMIMLLSTAMVLEFRLPIIHGLRRDVEQNTAMVLSVVFCELVGELYFRHRREAA